MNTDGKTWCVKEIESGEIVGSFGVMAADEKEIEWLEARALANGAVVRFRAVRPEDEPLISEAIRTASRETLLHRFFSPIRSVSPELLRQMLALDAAKEKCIVGVTSGEKERVICGARYVRLEGVAPLPYSDVAEIAITVHDEFQHCGLGSLLLQLLNEVARRDSIKRFEADVMGSNVKMLRLFKKMFPVHERSWRAGGVVHLVAELELIEPQRR
jgi:GNAT superfamily N-acetyltransferase